MTFRDVLKQSFWNNVAATDVTTSEIVLALAVAGLIGIYIFGVYRFVSRRTFYSKSFNISLVAIAVITAAIIITIQSSVVISLGMVGALSIVRFRTAIKEPMDLVFLFWAISVGIICGAGLYETVVLLSLAVTVIILVLELIPVSRAPMILVINGDNIDMEQEVLTVVKAYAKHYKVKSRNLTNQRIDLVIELRVKDGGGLVRELGQMLGIQSVSLLSHDGEVTF